MSLEQNEWISKKYLAFTSNNAFFVEKSQHNKTILMIKEYFINHVFIKIYLIRN